MWPHLRAANHPARLVSILEYTYTKPTTRQKTAEKEMFGVGYVSGSKHKNKGLVKGALRE